MKSKFTLVALMAVAASMFAATPEPKLVVLNTGKSELFKVIYESPVQEMVRLNIYDNKGTVVYAETLNLRGFIRPFNFNGLSYGEYTIEIVGRSANVSEKVSYARLVRTAKKTLTAGRQVADYIHVAKTKEGKYLLAGSNLDNEKINVNIYDEANNLIHSERMIINGSVGVVYNLKEVSGAPTFKVVDNAGGVKIVRY